MSSSCPDPSRLRAFAEGSSDEPDLAAHVERCDRCRRLVDLARREEAAIRTALPLEPPKDLLARTLKAVDAATGTPSRRKPALTRRPQGSPTAALIAAAALVAVVAIGLVFSKGSNEPVEAPSPAPSSSTNVRPPSPSSSQPTPAPSTSVTRSPEPLETPAEPSPEPSPSLVEASPQAPPSNEPSNQASPASAPSVAPGEVVASRVNKARARVRSGKVSVKGRALAPGDDVPDGELFEAPAVAEIECEASFTFVISPHGKASVKASASGELALALSPGTRVLTRTVGATKYALETPDARVLPLGTEIVVAVESQKTRVSLLEGKARVEVEKANASVEVRAGFEAEVSKGKAPEAPAPFVASRATAWLPEALRPKKTPGLARVVKAWTFETGLEGATRGEHVATGGARGSRGCVRGIAAGSDYAVSVEIDNLNKGVLTIDPELWVEASVKVDRKTTVVLQVWDTDAQENISLFTPVEPGVWTNVGGALKTFGDPRGKPRAKPLNKGDRGTCLSIFAGTAGEKLELLVDDVRLAYEQ